MQEKWNRSLSDANITIIETTYDIKNNDNKRELLYDLNNICFNTKPLKLNYNQVNTVDEALCANNK